MNLPGAATARPRVWTVALAVVVLAVGYVAMAALAFVAFALVTRPELLRPDATLDQRVLLEIAASLPGLLFTALVSSLWVGAVALVGGVLSPEPLRPRLGLVPPCIGPAAIAVALLGGLAVSQGADAILHLTGLGRGEPLERLLAILREARGAALAAALLVIGVAAGTFEELFFRGFVQRRLVARFGTPAGIVLAALVFGLAHVDPRHGLFAFLFGLYVGWLAHASNSVWPAVAAHVVNNIASVLLVVSGVADPGTGRAAHAVTLAVCLVVLALAVRFVRGRAVVDAARRPLVGSGP